MLERSSFINIENIIIKNIRGNGIQINKFSSNNTVKDCLIENTALDTNRYSQAIAIGSDFRFWVNNNPDRSNFNKISNNTIKLTNGVLIDVKEGSCCNTISDNSLDGTRISRRDDSWIRIRGDLNRIISNNGRVAPKYGYIVRLYFLLLRLWFIVFLFKWSRLQPIEKLTWADVIICSRKTNAINKSRQI